MTLVANPEKKIELNKSIEEIKKIIYRIPEWKGKLDYDNEIMNIYKISFVKMMYGNIIEITLTKINDTRTEINFKVHRFLGAFDSASEVDSAYNDISKIIDIITILYKNINEKSPKQIKEEKKQAKINQKEEKPNNKTKYMKFFKKIFIIYFIINILSLIIYAITKL